MNKHPGPGKRWEKGQSGNPKGDQRRHIMEAYLPGPPIHQRCTSTGRYFDIKEEGYSH
jgi:hypothetical protein